MVHDNGGEIVKKYPANVDREIILLIAGRIPNIRRSAACGLAKKGGWFPNAEHIHGTEPNGKWRLNYRLRRILRVCTAARYKRCSCRVCLSTEIDSRTTDGRRREETKTERVERGMGKVGGGAAKMVASVGRH